MWDFWLVLREARSAAIFQNHWTTRHSAYSYKHLVVGFRSSFPCSQKTWRLDMDQAWNFPVNLWRIKLTHYVMFIISVCSANHPWAILCLALLFVPNSQQVKSRFFPHKSVCLWPDSHCMRITSPLNITPLYPASLSAIPTLESQLLLSSSLPLPPTWLLHRTCFSPTHITITSLELIVFKERALSLLVTAKYPAHRTTFRNNR